MSKVLKHALPVLLVGVFALVLGASPASATCPFDVLITQGVDGGTLDEATCGSTPSSVFWLLGFGDPAVGFGTDNGAHLALVNPIDGGGQYWTSNWGEAGVDGCPVTDLQGDGTFGPMAVYINNAAGNYVVLSADLDEQNQFYNLDLASSVNVVCAPIPVPVVDSFTPTGGGFDVTLHWGNATNLLDDCATNPAIQPGDCAGGSRSLQYGWKVYSKEDDCTVGPLTNDRNFWIFEADVALGLNAGTTVPIDPASPGKCRFVAVSPVWQGFMEGLYLSEHSSPIGGTGDQDGDGDLDINDNCPTIYNDDQANGDTDGLGDACDNCDTTNNADQANADFDAFGDACDDCPADALNDADGDGVCGGVDNCPDDANADQGDTDGDGIGNVCDDCPLDADNDADGDGHCADVDNCPAASNADQADTDGDGMGNACDPCAYEKLDPSQEGFDKDGDGICSCDAVLGNAGLCPPGTYDNCPRVSNTSQTPSGLGDGLGSACEDKFGAVGVITTRAAGQNGDNGLGDCRFRFKTLNEWNCPQFRVVYRSPGGDRPAIAAPIPCRACTRGTGVSATFYPSNSGAYVKYCHGGHDMYVVAVRSNPNACPGFVVPTAVANVKVSKVASRPR
jgi:hypothetical protein